jgi:hypothetical protein
MYHYNSALCGTAASSDAKHQGSNPTVGAIDADQGAEARKRQRADDDICIKWAYFALYALYA